MIIFADSRDPIFNSRDPNRVPKTPQKNPELTQVEIQTNKDFYMRIVAPRNFFTEFMHEVRSTTRLPI